MENEFLNVEIIVCWDDNTWTTEIVTIPFESESAIDRQIDSRFFSHFNKKHENKHPRDVVHLGVYNYTLDEVVDSEGNLINE